MSKELWATATCWMRRAKFVALAITFVAAGLGGGAFFVRPKALSAQAAYAAEAEGQARLERAIFDAARVYAKAGCGDYNLVRLTAQYAIAAELPANVVAAKVVVESRCNPLAVSDRGAVGLTQVRPSVWRKEYDFASLNLFNPETSLQVGTEILGGLVKKHGLRTGLARYNGRGPGADAYAAKVLAIAEEKTPWLLAGRPSPTPTQETLPRSETTMAAALR